MGRAERITKYIKNYDYKLTCREIHAGKLGIFREYSHADSYHLSEGKTLSFVRPAYHFIFALTDNWRTDGTPVEWGFDPILRKIQRADLWKEDVAGRLENAYDERVKSNERDLRNNNEAFLSDFRGQFKKAFSDINVSNLEKPKIKKRKEEL